MTNRLMDYLEQFLELSELGREVSAPSQDQPLEGYRTFIDEFVVRVGKMAELLRHAKGNVEVDPVALEMDVDDQLLARITKRLTALPS